MGLIDFGAILVAAIAAFGAWAAQRAAAKASNTNTEVSAKLEAEKDAYERARNFDIETIERQDAEIEKLRRQLADSRSEVHKLRNDVIILKNRVRKLELHYPDDERLLDERTYGPDDH